MHTGSVPVNAHQIRVITGDGPPQLAVTKYSELCLSIDLHVTSRQFANSHRLFPFPALVMDLAKVSQVHIKI